MLGILVISGCLFQLGTADYAFKVTDCSPKGTNIIRLDKYSVSPYPPKLPGKLTADVHGELLQNLNSTLQMKLSLKRHVLIDIPIPCVSGVGSCTYNNICEIIRTMQCPPELKKNNFPCHCPFVKGTYALNHMAVDIPHVPSSLSWLLSGDYKIHMELRDQDKSNTMLSCFDVQLTLTDGGCSGFLCSIFG